MRSPIKVACSSILLLLAPLCAAAFESVNISPGQSEEMQSGNANTSQDVSASLSGTRTLSGQHQPDGTAINIPGLGTVGVIPKLDFGMELLYSDENKQQTKPSPEDDDDDDALQIRGTIKHRF